MFNKFSKHHEAFVFEKLHYVTVLGHMNTESTKSNKVNYINKDFTITLVQSYRWGVTL